jgi:hypothetical protein
MFPFFCCAQWTPVSWQNWENYNVTSGPYAHAEHNTMLHDGAAVPTTKVT